MQLTVTGCEGWYGKLTGCNRTRIYHLALKRDPVSLHFALIYTREIMELTFKEVELKIIACLAKLDKDIASESGKGIQ